MSWHGFLAVGVGGALGSWLRWGLGIALNPVFSGILLGTLAANLLGGYLVGVAVEYFVRNDSIPPEWRSFVIVGFLGGLTTFSSFSRRGGRTADRPRAGLDAGADRRAPASARSL
jgi:CrcB protein